MPSFCPPCWPSKATSHFDEPELLVPPDASVNPAKEGSILAKPTSAEYAGEATKALLDALEAVADQIPLPGVSAVVKIAKSIMQACDDSHATLERAEELKLRIKNLVIILVDELKGKKEEEIQAKLQEDIQSLSKDLEHIQEKLNEIGSQNALLVIVFRSLNEDKVKKCVGRLDNSLANFGLVRQINDAKLLSTLEKEILAFHTSHQKSLDDMKGKVDHIHATLDDVKAILEERRDLPTTSSSPRRRIRAAIPANADIFHGRDTLVSQLVHILTSNLDGQKRPRVCLLGPGGMGKTSTALAVMAHPEMRQHFPEQNQIWVPCVKATSVALFLDTLYSSLGTSRNTGDTLKDIISEIKSSAEPLVILLDNFETPWNVMESRSQTEQILYELGQIAHVVLFITMRSSILPCHGDQWLSFPIGAVDEEAARRIYVDICSAGSDDDKLSVLLHNLGYMPLAVTLMAKMAESFGWGAGKLIEKYERMGTAMVGQGEDANHSLNVCISLSVDSPPMKKHPEAYDLLATLAMLPVGTSDDALEEWWARDSPNLLGALQVLTETALIQRRGTHYFVLPVIRSYILDPSRFPGDVRTMMIASACNFLNRHDSSPGDSSFKAHADSLSAEEGNLQAILLEATDPESDLIKAFLVLARHQLSTRPRLEVIEHALKLARRMESHRTLVGEALSCYGQILHNLDRYDQAEEQFSLAHKTFLSIPDERRAARCTLDLVDLYQSSVKWSEKRLPLVLHAKSVFENLDDTPGVALSFYFLGSVKGQSGYRTEGIESLTRAKEMFQDLGDLLNHAKCSHWLQLIYYWMKRYDEALVLGKAAVQEYQHLGQYPGDPMAILGRTLFMQGKYPDALKILFPTLAVCKSYGRPTDIAAALEIIGRTWAKMGRIADAKGAYAEAMAYYGTIEVNEGERGLTRCQFLARQAESPFLDPTDQERDVLEGLYRDFASGKHWMPK